MGDAQKSRALPVAVLVLVLVGFGCADLGAIRKFAKAGTTTARYTKLVDDYQRSPERQKRLYPTVRHADLDRDTKARREQRERLLGLQQTLAAYLSALGALARNEVIQFDPALNKLGRAARKADVFTVDDRRTSDALSKLIVRAATDTWRRRQLRMFIV